MKLIPSIFRQPAPVAAPVNQLPDLAAMKKQLGILRQQGLAHAISQVWVQGLERMEIGRGQTFHHDYLHKLIVHAGVQLQLYGLTILLFGKENSPCVFYCGKNTLGLITLPLNTIEHERLQKTLQLAFETVRHEQGYNQTVTPVIASSNAFCMVSDPNQGIQHAEIALAQCVENNQALLLYNDDIGYNKRRQAQLLEGFETALSQNQFYLEWQPQLDAKTHKLAGLEALVRWRHPEYGLITPAQFIPLLEQNFRISRLSSWVIQEVFSVAPEFFAHYPGLDISVNLSVYDLMDDGLLEAIDDIIDGSAEDFTDRIILEVSESAQIENNPTILKTVEELQARGFRLSIDDFGAGHVSFGYLQKLSVNELKIDRRYTETCHEANSQAIIGSMMELATRLQLKVVVEGIEDQRQEDLFTRWGVHRLQGWRLGMPLTQQAVFAVFSTT